MTPIHKFILHVTHNLFPLNEYSEGEIRKLMDKFKEEAEDYDYKISDAQLKKYIERFDQLKNSPKITEKDLRKYSLSKLIKLVTSSEGGDVDDEEPDDTPDVVYHEGNIIIYNGSKEGNCINFGRGESWCITRGSFANYRYSSNYNYPTFYLAKNTNLPNTDPLSFVAIQVRDSDDPDEKYAYTNRKNSPGMSGAMSFESLVDNIPWLEDVPNIRAILKYIPISKAEKAGKIWQQNSINIGEWMKLPFNLKKQYLVVRARENNIFNDIDKNDFFTKYLPKYPQIAQFIAITPGLINTETLLKYFDFFDGQAKKSIVSNIREPISLSYLLSNYFPFELKKLITKLKKWKEKFKDGEEKVEVYITKDENAIVSLSYGSDLKMSITTEDDNYPNVKINKRTIKYLLDYPELDKIPFKYILKYASEGLIDKNITDTLLNKAKEDPESNLSIKKKGENSIILDTGTLDVYKMGADGKINKVNINDEDAKEVLNSDEVKPKIIRNVKKVFSDTGTIPLTLNKDFLIDIISEIPYNERIVSIDRANYILLSAPPNRGSQLFLGYANVDAGGGVPLYQFPLKYKTNEDNWRKRVGEHAVNPTNEMFHSYFSYLRATNQTISDAVLYNTLRTNKYIDGSMETAKVNFINSNPPLAANSKWALGSFDGVSYLGNRIDPRDSYKISPLSGKLVKANLPYGMLRNMRAGVQPAAPAVPNPVAQPNFNVAGGGVQINRGRGRPAGVPNAPRLAQPVVPAAAPAAAPVVAGNVNIVNLLQPLGLAAAYGNMTRGARRRLADVQGVQAPIINDRGASRRNNMLGARGQVVRIYNFGASTVYIIRLANNHTVASVVIQPGNEHFILAAEGNVIRLNTPADLANVIQANNLEESLRGHCIRMYIANQPQSLNEIKTIIKNYANESNMKKIELKEIIRGLVREMLIEDPMVAPSKPRTNPTVHPGTKPSKPEPRRPLGNPNVKPKPKAIKEEEIVNKIVARFKSKK